MCALNLIYCFNNACRIFLRRHSTPNERIQLLLVAFILWCLNISIINKINCHLFYISSTTVFLTVQTLNQFHFKQQQKNFHLELYSIKIVNFMWIRCSCQKLRQKNLIQFSYLFPLSFRNESKTFKTTITMREWIGNDFLFCCTRVCVLFYNFWSCILEIVQYKIELEL